MSDAAADGPFCTFHPKVPTLLSCTRCERPACPDCLVPVSVGMQCTACVEARSEATPNVARELTAHARRQRRPGWLFWAITGVFVLFCVLVSQMSLFTVDTGDTILVDSSDWLRVSSFALVVSGWVVSLCLHEWAHAFVAYRSGDYSVLGRGYLTLDPRKYADPIFSVALPIAFLILGGIGLPGGAVWIDHANIRSRHRRALVSLAGPVVNIVFGIVCIAIVSTGFLDATPALKASLTYLGWLEFATAALNLLPVPGLDGYGIVEPYLPYGLRALINPIANYAVIILLILMISTSFGSFLFEIADASVEAMGRPAAEAQIGRFIGDVRVIGDVGL